MDKSIKKTSKISLISSVGNSLIISKSGKNPWNCPESEVYFLNKILGKPLIMGSKTYSELGSPFDGCMNIVLTKNDSLTLHKDIYRAISVEESLSFCKKYYQGDSEEIMVLGGKQVFQEFFEMDLIDRIYILSIHREIPVDKTCLFFEYPVKKFAAVYAEPTEPFTLLMLERKYGK
jgi:dihydrofolate reductase